MMIMIVEGVILASFSQITYFPIAIVVLILFSLSVQMAEGATFTVVPFINKKCVGSVSGIVGAGGNAGAVLAGLLLKSQNKAATAAGQSEAVGISNSFLILGGLIIFAGIATALVRFSAADEAKVAEETQKSLEATTA